MLREFYHGLKRNRPTSALMQACDIVLPTHLAGISSPVYRRTISGHWGADDYEQDCRATFRKMILGTGAKSLFDIGANVGIYAAEFLAMLPDADVIAIEPNERVFNCLKQTCADA